MKTGRILRTQASKKARLMSSVKISRHIDLEHCVSGLEFWINVINVEEWWAVRIQEF